MTFLVGWALARWRRRRARQTVSLSLLFLPLLLLPLEWLMSPGVSVTAAAPAAPNASPTPSTPFQPQLTTPELTDHYRALVRYHVRMDGNVPDRSVVFIGDSLTQGLATDAVVWPSVNYGIGSDTTVGVLTRLPEYHSLRRASAVVLAIGVNDLLRRDTPQIVENYRRILAELPAGLPIVCSALLPVNEPIYGPSVVNNARIRELNIALKKVCADESRCVFVDAGGGLADPDGNLRVSFQDGDGIHLNSAGNQVWIETLRQALGSAWGRSGGRNQPLQSVDPTRDRRP